MMAYQRQERDADLIVAIDFGTSYSGYAFQLYDQYRKDPTKIDSPQAWNSGRKNLVSTKTPTCLLLNERRELDECPFGFEAEEKYMELCINKTNHKYYFFRRFKMQLQDGQGLTKSSIIQDETGKEMLALDIFALSIKSLKIHLMDLLKVRGINVEEKNIFWVLTVPAIWNDAAKQFMREAAIMADIKSEKLDIALEPEAASYFCQYVPVSTWSGREQLALFAAAPPGTKYMVVDLGGMNTKVKSEMLKEMCALFSSLNLNYTDRSDVLEAYNNWAEIGYDKVYSSDVFYAPRKTAEVLEDLYPLDIDKKGVKILDVGAGTGLCGVELRKLGFRNIDGLEPSEKMMKEAMKKDVYDRYIIEFITEARLSIPDNFYDVVTACNCARHFPDGFPEIARIVRPGGVLVILSNYDATDMEMETMVQKLDDEGVWRIVRKEIIDDFFSIANQRGILILLEVLTDGRKLQRM